MVKPHGDKVGVESPKRDWESGAKGPHSMAPNPCSGPVADPWMAWLCSGPVALQRMPMQLTCGHQRAKEHSHAGQLTVQLSSPRLAASRIQRRTKPAIDDA